ncbi:FAA hydrolase family protein [Pseudooceanicola sediminis]|uniref:FAA hydrolase family protein n=1 Tax=Pseudooceanicola sediminis TaxID=2211117 RepID=A0A399JBY7_9RHOB|nr:fumarylacetoacetate hydrolase family protein [Pseudooceanicola sediminis]KAA2315676.1 fumarylacetoacetate hydrolase family protein [Puniceibacterium sp. HSS470]RII40126.1 FAA hydrolase family protein [Pseudooceanicola sediminis]|tara:strand:+ start:54593 stop:55282 length:690 start_codon:yes stop_codon:yes gene_type:complete
MSLFDLPPIPDIPVTGETEGYPVRRIFCVGRNYAAHAAEFGNEVPDSPFYFTKSPASMILSGGTAPYPPGTTNYHFEMELAVAIGAPVFKCAPEDAAAAVYGYACALDMTRRDLQIAERNKQRPWDLGKDVENSAVIGPITKAADFGAVAKQAIELTLDGTTKQKSTLNLMIHDVAAIISHLSGFYHLRAGDMILTGTPEGVGPVAPGNVIEGTIDGLTPVRLTIAEAA